MVYLGRAVTEALRVTVDRFVQAAPLDHTQGSFVGARLRSTLTLCLVGGMASFGGILWKGGAKINRAWLSACVPLGALLAMDGLDAIGADPFEGCGEDVPIWKNVWRFKVSMTTFQLSGLCVRSVLNGMGLAATGCGVYQLGSFVQRRTALCTLALVGGVLSGGFLMTFPHLIPLAKSLEEGHV